MIGNRLTGARGRIRVLRRLTALSITAVLLLTDLNTAAEAGYGAALPSVTLGPSHSVTRPAATTITGTITPGAGTAQSLTVEWADGYADSVAWAAQGPTSTAIFTFDDSDPARIVFAVRHSYTTPGHHRVAVTLADQSGGNVTAFIDEWVRAPSTVRLSVTPAIPAAGQEVTYRATVDAEATRPGGSVSFSESGAIICSSVPLSLDGPFTATCSTRYAAAGIHQVAARYTGSHAATPGQADPLSVTVTKATTEVTVTASPSSPAIGQPVTYTATLAGLTSAPIGAVSIVDNGATVCAGRTPTATAPYTASCTTTYLAAGSHAVSARYDGDSGSTANVSDGIVVHVRPAATAITLTAPAQSWTFGDVITYTATIAGSAQPPTGQVLFFQDDVPVCGPAVPSVVPPHIATCRIPAVPGQHLVVARYTGDAHTAPAISAPLTVTTAKAHSTTTATADRTSTRIGQPVIVTVDVSGLPFGLAPRGTVTVMDGASSLCSVPLARSAPYRATCRLAFSTTGKHRVSVAYSGDQFGTSSSADALGFDVDSALSQWRITSSSAEPMFGQEQRFTVVGSPGSAGLPALTGTVTFAVDGTALGPAVAVVGNRAASISVRSFVPGRHTVTVRYSGDGRFAPASSTIEQTVGCARTITGAEAGTFIVTSSMCVSGAVLRGPIEVRPGGALALDHSVVNGAVTAISPAAVRVCGSHPSGPVSVSGSSGPVLIGGRPGSNCPSNRIDGALSLSHNTGVVTVAGNTIQGPLTIAGNTGGVTLAANTLATSLSCSSNVPAPTDAGQPNHVAGSAAGECALLAAARPLGNLRVGPMIPPALPPALPSPSRARVPVVAPAPQTSPHPSVAGSVPRQAGGGSRAEASGTALAVPVYGQSAWQLLAMMLSALMVGGVLFGLRRRPAYGGTHPSHRA